MTLAEELKRLRALEGLTLRDVEKKTSITNGYLNQLENGKIKEPSPNILYKLSNVYNYSYETLLRLAGYQVPSRANSNLVAGTAFSAHTLTPDEEKELLDYLGFMRRKGKSRKKRG